MDSRYKYPIARNPMIALVAGGGFEPPTFGLWAQRPRLNPHWNQ